MRQNVAPAVAVINGSQSQGLIHTSVFPPSFPNAHEHGLFGGPHSGQVVFRDGGVKKVRWTMKDKKKHRLVGADLLMKTNKDIWNFLVKII